MRLRPHLEDGLEVRLVSRQALCYHVEALMQCVHQSPVVTLDNGAVQASLLVLRGGFSKTLIHGTNVPNDKRTE